MVFFFLAIKSSLMRRCRAAAVGDNGKRCLLLILLLLLIGAGECSSSSSLMLLSLCKCNDDDGSDAIVVTIAVVDEIGRNDSLPIVSLRVN